MGVETDRDRQRQTETDRDRQRQTETDRDRPTLGVPRSPAHSPKPQELGARVELAAAEAPQGRVWEASGLGLDCINPLWDFAAFQWSLGTVHRLPVCFRCKPTDTHQLVTHSGATAQIHGEGATAHLTPQSRLHESSRGSEGHCHSTRLLLRLHDADFFCGCHSKACDRAAWAHSIMVASAKDGGEAAASPLLDLAKLFTSKWADRLWEQGKELHFPLRFLA